MIKTIIKSLKSPVPKKKKKQLKTWFKESKENRILYENLKKSYGKGIGKSINILDAKRQVLAKNRKVKYRRLIFKGLKYAAFITLALGLYHHEDGIDQVINPPDYEKETTLELDGGEIKVLNPESTIQREVLDSNGTIVAHQSGNQIKYSMGSSNEHQGYHRLTIPNGKVFRVILADGSLVDLNSDSSMFYPINFVEGESRKVFLQGEAYFHIAKDNPQPFLVNTKDLNVKVYGTEFNLSVYPNDPSASIVLVDGLVDVSTGSFSNHEEVVTLNPGQMAQVNIDQNQLSIEKVNVEEHVAWKDGMLVFVETPFDQILKKLERRFDVSFENRIERLNDQRFTGKFYGESVEDILNVFSRYSSFQYQAIGHKILIHKPIEDTF